MALRVRQQEMLPGKTSRDPRSGSARPRVGIMSGKANKICSNSSRRNQLLPELQGPGAAGLLSRHLTQTLSTSSTSLPKRTQQQGTGRQWQLQLLEIQVEVHPQSVS